MGRKMLLIKGLICKLKEQMRIHKHHVEWMKKNTHNKTWQVGVFPHDYVEVGNGTYGPINVSVDEKDGKCIIGNFCSIAPDVKFMISSEHPLQYISTYPFKTKYGFHGESDAISKGDIIVEDDVWIGEGVRILSGVKIGQGAVIGTGAVVTHDIPPYAVCGGCLRK